MDVKPGVHDIGGQPGGPIDITEHEAAPWAKLVTAINSAMRDNQLTTVDELRRALESLTPEVYDLGYFERWTEAMVDLFEEKEFLSRAAVEERMTALKRQLEARK